MALRNRLHELFPALKSDYRITSPEAEAYNCIAWAAGVDLRWWWPNVECYWPSGVLLEDSIPAFVAAFGTLGYEPCGDGTLESGYEKVAIYHRPPNGVQHMARQLHTGKWTSKLGLSYDIEHGHPRELEGSEYGIIGLYMRRATC